MQSIEFIKSIYKLTELPKRTLPVVILCGRSNVGKSSFINSIFNINIAQTSSTPGKTRSLNYYLADNKFYLVDLPGFGYAKVSKTERFAWQDLIGRYLSLNNDIRLAIHVIDSRHEPTALDLELNRILRSKSVAYILLLNKADKLKQSETSKAKNGISKIFPEIIYGENCFLYSSTNGTGKKEVARLLDVLFGT